MWVIIFIELNDILLIKKFLKNIILTIVRWFKAFKFVLKILLIIFVSMWMIIFECKSCKKF